METQKAQVLADLKTGNPITPLDALQKYGCFRLASRIHDLRNEGWPIEMEMVRDDRNFSYAKYYLKADRSTWPC